LITRAKKCANRLRVLWKLWRDCHSFPISLKEKTKLNTRKKVGKNLVLSIMTKSNIKKLVAGAAVAAALGAVAGMLLAPESGKKLRKDIKKTAGQLYREAVPKLKKMRNVGQAEFEKFMSVAASKFASAKKLSSAEKKQLIKEAKGAWGKIKKHL